MGALRNETFRSLEDLYTILEAGERGYAVAAATADNRALKLLFKTHARQRAGFKQDLARRAGDRRLAPNALVELMAMIHRGRMDIFAALTIGEQERERVVLKEVLVGERAALHAYERVLRTGLPEDVRQMVQRQSQQVQQVVERVRLMRGERDRQLVVRLFDSQHEADQAVQHLRQAGFESAAMQRVAVEQETTPYGEGRRGRLVEAIASGATGGAMWGSVSGALAGIGVLQRPGLGLQHAALTIQEFAWAVTALGAIFSGAFVGAVLGAFIGWGVQGGDAYLYDDSQRRGQVLLRLQTSPSRGALAAQIMAEVNRDARTHQRHALA